MACCLKPSNRPKETASLAIGDVSSAVPGARAAKNVWEVVPLYSHSVPSTSDTVDGVVPVM